ncbi:RNA dependent RNA polymerase-domain-containing protein [Aspergillus avenaceus]|uniref:RNA-directed RNA polymerase n=1 Tax=Aspergillus avenaceus TaxID=36643 RepID=A0A5N6TNA6_ASPAV|nr:RNA dependent RNA polymerase-domain-containing protein [Aspergillus avenaceus]
MPFPRGPGVRGTRSRGRSRPIQPSSRHLPNTSQQQSQPAQLLLAPWRSWDSVAVNVSKLPPGTSTLLLWRAFNSEGNIFSIDLFEDSHGDRVSSGKIRFKPPPKTDFWRGGEYIIKRLTGQPIIVKIALDVNHALPPVPSPVRNDVFYPVELELPIASMDIGVLLNETTMLPLRSVGASLNEHPLVVVNLKQRALLVCFHLPISSQARGHGPANVVYHRYRLRIPLSQLTRVHETHDPVTNCNSHWTVLDSPPLYYRRIGNTEVTFSDESNSWRESEAWFRQTHIVRKPLELSPLPVSLKKPKALIDIGRWNVFKITYLSNADVTAKLRTLRSILEDYNVKFEHTDCFTQSDGKIEPSPPIWKWIDVSDTPNSQVSPSSLEDLFDQDYIHLSFAVRYLLEVCISNGYLSEYTMTREFPIKLSELGETEAVKLLEHVATKKQVYYDPMKIFDLKFIKGVTRPKIPSYCCYMRSARITPSSIYYNIPTVDTSNRVIRHYIEHADRFLRVRFTDEKMLSRINSTTDDTMDEVFTRVKRVLANGIVIGDRRYEFLAFGNSQFREHGAYFFAPLPNLTAANIRAWMGHFNSIRNIAKHAARLGQCFSTTRAIAGCPVNVVKIDDIERNDYTFSDGIGKISRFLAQMSMTELKIKTPTGDPPSAFQFRLGGCKGMLAVSPDVQPQEVHIRKSQDKFAAMHNWLEIIRWSQFSVATLNRQLILVLSALGVLDGVFHEKLRIMLQGLNETLESDSKAVYWLKKYVDPNEMTLTVSQMVLDGFRGSKEPFLTSIMTLWRAWHIKYLKEKARIALDKGACLLGCIDETGILQGYFNNKIPRNDASIEVKLAALPEIFVQVSRPDTGGTPEVIEGLCILARNPSLHPGDIRVVRAVNVPELRNLRDVVVLPQTGDRDVASMCSGGDLDGDDYLVIWDEDLIPQDWFRQPMHYTSNKARDLDTDVTVNDITSFFVTYMKNDFLPRIAHAHLAWADFLENGVNEERCIRLAHLHSDAVDYNKTGTPAILTRNLVPRKWPHFMEKANKSKDTIYHSNKILGQLYDAVERVDFVPALEMPFDKRLLECELEIPDELVTFAKSLKEQYDSSMRRIMAQHDIRTEFEVWSTFVLHHANASKDYKFHEEIGTISASLREAFKNQCYGKVGGRTFERLAPLALAMYRVTHEEMTAALDKHRAGNPVDDKLYQQPALKVSQLPFISFPWIFPHILGKIAKGHYDVPERAVEVNNDPFDLFIDSEEQKPSFKNTGSVTLSTRDLSESIESLEHLLDFGMLPTEAYQAPSVAAQDESSNLLEFDDSPGRGGSGCVVNSQDIFSSPVPKRSASPSGGGSSGGGCVVQSPEITTSSIPKRSASPSGGGSSGGGCVVQSPDIIYDVAPKRSASPSGGGSNGGGCVVQSPEITTSSFPKRSASPSGGGSSGGGCVVQNPDIITGLVLKRSASPSGGGSSGGGCVVQSPDILANAVPKSSASPSGGGSGGGGCVVQSPDIIESAIPNRSASPSGGSNGGGCIVQSAETTFGTLRRDKDGCVEIFEEEGDLKPTALDRLNELLGL